MGMKVVHHGHALRLELGGVVRAVLDLTSALADRGHDVTLLHWDDSGAPDAWKAGKTAGVPKLLDVGPVRPLIRLGGDGLLRAEAAIHEADLLHLHAMWQPSNTQLAAIAKRVGTPYIVTVHGMLDDWCMAQSTLKKRAYLALGGGNAMLRDAAVVQCTAKAELTQAQKFFPEGRGAVVGNLMELDDYADLPGPAEAEGAFDAVGPGRPVVLFLSRVHVKKGVHHLVDAAAILRERGVDASFVVAGTGDEAYLDRIRTQIAEKELGDRVHLVGMVTGRTKVSLFQRADVFCLPTSQENWGFVLIEALLCETPVVTTRAVDIWPELTESGGSVIVDEPEGALAARFADVIEERLGDTEGSAAMGRKGRAWVLEHLTRDAILDDVEAMYARAVSRGRV